MKFRTKLLFVMKLTTALILFTAMHLYAKTSAQIVSYSARNAKLEQVFRALEQQTGYGFFYQVSDLKNAQPVSVAFKNLALPDALKMILKNQTLEFFIYGKTVFITPKKKEESLTQGIYPGLDLLQARTIDVRGTIKDENGKPIAGASVVVKGSTKGVSTNENGEFELKGVDDNATLVISGVNIERLEIKVNGREELGILKTTAKISELADVTITAVNTGYQQIPKERATGSFVQIDNQLYNRRVSSDVISRLEGIVPGLIFNRNVITQNAPTGFDLSIRGQSTLLSNNQPLIVIDNFPYDGNINNINPNDVESVTLLKDAAAASIWGARSGNGVIVITTKKGKKNQVLTTSINSNVSIGSRPNLYYSSQFMFSTDYIDVEKNLFNAGYYNSNLVSTNRPAMSPVVKILALQRAGAISSADADVQIDALRNIDVRDGLSTFFYQKSINQQYSISLKGGGEKSDYFFSMGYDKNKANTVGDNYRRISLNTINNFYLTKKIQLQASLSHIESKSFMNSPVGDITVASKPIYPYAKFIDANGTPIGFDKDYSSFYTDTVGSGKLLGWSFVPLNELSLNDNTSNIVDSRLNLGLNIAFLKHFSFDAKYQYQKSLTIEQAYANDSSYQARLLYNKFTNLVNNTHPVPAGGILRMANSSTLSNRFRCQVNFTQIFKNEHSINALAGFEVNQAIRESNSNTALGYNLNLKTSVNYDNVSVFPILPSGTSKIPGGYSFVKYTDRFISYYANASYSYKSRYTLSGSARIDKSNLFGVRSNQKAIPLYSIGLGWDMLKETFFKLNWLSSSKLRATFGYNGNVNTSVAAITTFATVQNSASNGITYAQIAAPGNPELRWERVSMFNLGYDFGFLGNRIQGSIEYYAKKGIDLIGDSPIPGSTGFTTYRGNTANTSGHGIDIALHSRNINRNSFEWTTDFILSQAIDVVTKYGVTQTAATYLQARGNNGGQGNAVYPLEGKPLYSLFSYPFAGLDPVNGDPIGYLKGVKSKSWSTIISSTTADSMLYEGPSRPRVYGYFRNSFSFKGVTLSFNIVYKLDYVFRRTSISGPSLFGSWIANMDYYKRWQKPGDELSTNIPSLRYPPVDNNREMFFANSSALVENGDHVRLQDISLSYAFPSKTLKSLGIKDLQVYSYFNNIGIIWRANKLKLDPDLYRDNLPLPFAMSIGIKSTF